ncbi:DUF177 domain-containing protein [Marinilabiliaceae bacterium JC017]|nr:DUF177 domain-containing protein [Marinilabiliaceae bacterium JC017]
MDKLKDYGISFKGLKDGRHTYEYAIGRSFFELIEEPLVENGDVQVFVELNKSQTMLVLDFDIHGNVESICDNCLAPVNIDVSYQGKLYVKFGEEYQELSDEIIVLPHEVHELNVAQWIYEFIIISLPIRHIHPDDENGEPLCDKNMLKKLDQYLVDTDHIDEEEDNIDPRWEALKKFTDKNK